MTIYQKLIREYCPVDVSPRHIEAWLRDTYGALDAISVDEFQRAINSAVAVSRADPELSERLADSMGVTK